MQSINNKASELRIFKLPNARRLKMLDGTIGTYDYGYGFPRLAMEAQDGTIFGRII